MKNVKQTLKFPLYVIAPEVAPKDFRKQIVQLQQSEASGNYIDFPLRTLLDEVLPEKVKKTIKSFGVDYPHEHVEITLEAGQLLLDLFVCGTPTPESPVQKRSFERRLGELSQEFVQSDIQVPDAAKPVIKKVMAEGSEWQKANGHVYIVVDGQKRYFPIKSQGLDFFSEVLNAVMDELEHG